MNCAVSVENMLRPGMKPLTGNFGLNRVFKPFGIFVLFYATTVFIKKYHGKIAELYT
jgi:hypothetical protein